MLHTHLGPVPVQDIQYVDYINWGFSLLIKLQTVFIYIFIHLSSHCLVYKMSDDSKKCPTIGPKPKDLSLQWCKTEEQQILTMEMLQRENFSSSRLHSEHNNKTVKIVLMSI